MSLVERETVTAVPSILDPRVERGAALLDERMPGWEAAIDLDVFDLGSDRRCILGQVGLCVFDSDYVPTVERLFNIGRGWDSITEEERTHGFVGDDTIFNDWGILEQDWRLAILSRRQAA